jgi:hypothetical protein
MPSKIGSGAQVLTNGTNVPFGLMRIRIPIFTRALFSFLSNDRRPGIDFKRDQVFGAALAARHFGAMRPLRFRERV